VDIEYKVLQLADIEEVLAFEEAILSRTDMDENEKMMSKWSSHWRQEALEHYFPLGWSMGAWAGRENDRKLLGYFMAQALLFFQGKTQVLWVEHVQSTEENLRHDLIDIAYRMSREKHLQSIIFSNHLEDDTAFSSYKRKNAQHRMLEVPTTKGGL